MVDLPDARWMPGMAVSIGGGLLRVLKVHHGDFLEADDHVELLVCAEEEGATPSWVMPRYVTVLLDDPTTRSLLAWYCDDAPSSSSTSPSRRLCSSSGKTSSASSSSSAGTADAGVDIDALVERLRSSVENHPSDAAWHLLAHAERDILDLVQEVRRLRRMMANLPDRV